MTEEDYWAGFDDTFNDLMLQDIINESQLQQDQQQASRKKEVALPFTLQPSIQPSLSVTPALQPHIQAIQPIHALHSDELAQLKVENQKLKEAEAKMRQEYAIKLGEAAMLRSHYEKVDFSCILTEHSGECEIERTLGGKRSGNGTKTTRKPDCITKDCAYFLLRFID